MRRSTSVYSSSSSSSSGSNNNGGENSSSNPDMPPHDLEPPKFCRLALERIFSDFEAVKQILLFNHRSSPASSTSEEPIDSHSSLLMAEFDEDSGYVDAQSGSIDLDKFVYFLLLKSPHDLLVLLVETLKKSLAAADGESDAPLAVRRFVRSVARLFSILCMESHPSSLQIDLANSSTGGNNAVANNPVVTRPGVALKRPPVFSAGRSTFGNDYFLSHYIMDRFLLFENL